MWLIGGEVLSEIITERLILHCQTLNEMKESMECGDELAKDFYNAYTYHQEHSPNYNLLWLRLWQFVCIQEGVVVGGACFKGEPNEDGMVEIGYGIEEEYQNKGYATEAIGALIGWAHTQSKVTYVTVEIEKNNIASQKVVEHLGIARFEEKDDYYYYRAYR